MKLTNKEPVDNIFLVKEVAVKERKNGGNYLDLRLVDKDNDIRAKMWTYCGEKEPFEPMTLQRITGTVSEYNGLLQIIVSTYRSVDEKEVDITDYVPTAPINPDEALDYIYNVIDSFDNSELAALTRRYVKEVEDNLLYYPAAVSCHDAVRCGLLHHTIGMLVTAKSICEAYPTINRSLLLSGVIMHDLAKIEEIDSCKLGIATKYTVKGNLFGHLVMGAIKVDKLCDELGTSDEIRMLVEHMLISHHGKPEFGAAKVPMLLEAQVLNILDDLDAKIYEFNEAVEEMNNGTLSPKIFPLGNIQVYKPTI